METGHAAPLGLFVIFRFFAIDMALLTELALAIRTFVATFIDLKFLAGFRQS